MTLITRSITNTSSSKSLSLFIPGYDTNNPVVIAPSATLDLLSVLEGETLHAMQGQLAALVADGSITVAAQMQSSALWPAALFSYIAAQDTQVVFNPTSASGTHTVGATTAVQIETATGAIDTFDSSTTVTVAASGGTSPLLNGHASPIMVTVSSGLASILVTDSMAGSITLSISAVSRTLTHSSTCAVTLS